MRKKVGSILFITVVVSIPLAYLYWPFRQTDASRDIGYYKPEHRLAILGAGGRFVPANDPTVEQFANLLDQMGKKCLNSREEIADSCVSVHRQLREKGKNVSLLQVAQSLDAAVPEQRGLADIKGCGGQVNLGHCNGRTGTN